jgi:Asp-tRNA(Asn)/Glu-tRNA(Gln) amidotransferase A subunit family amidase
MHLRFAPREKEIGNSDDLTVARVRKDGAIVLGKTNKPEFGGRSGDER